MKNIPLILALLLAAPAAFADAAPPKGYVEACTVARVQKANEHCVARRAWHQDYWGCGADQANLPRDKVCEEHKDGAKAQCCKAWLAAGWTHRCKTLGASVFKMIWCRPRKPSDPPKPPVVPARKKGCSLPGAAGSGLAALPLVAGLLLVLRRRR